ncbi:hypothetical protein JXR93_09090 [bacterium]|nr:hypothetical protein [bacterium]
MLNFKNFIYFILLLNFSLYGKTEYKTVIKLDFHDKNPSELLKKKPYKSLNFLLNELNLESKEESCVSYLNKSDNKRKKICSDCIFFLDESNGNEIKLCKDDFIPSQHKYDFDKYQIDKKVAFGHDGFSSLEYVKINFHTKLSEISISNRKSKYKIDILDKNYPIHLHPYISKEKKYSSIKVYKFRKYFQYLIVIIGGDGAGSYENYLFVDIYNKGWIFSKDINTETVSFIPISKQKDLFKKDNEKLYYNIELFKK